MDIFDGNITNWKDISGMDQDILIFRFSDLTNYYTEEELGDEFQYVPQKISELVAKEPGIIAFFPKQYLLENDFQGKVLPEEKIRPYLMEADKRGLLAPFYLELTTGLRRGEICGLKWEDFDAENGKLKRARLSCRRALRNFCGSEKKRQSANGYSRISMSPKNRCTPTMLTTD